MLSKNISKIPSILLLLGGISLFYLLSSSSSSYYVVEGHSAVVNSLPYIGAVVVISSIINLLFPDIFRKGFSILKLTFTGLFGLVFVKMISTEISPMDYVINRPFIKIQRIWSFEEKLNILTQYLQSNSFEIPFSMAEKEKLISDSGMLTDLYNNARILYKEKEMSLLLELEREPTWFEKGLTFVSNHNGKIILAVALLVGLFVGYRFLTVNKSMETNIGQANVDLQPIQNPVLTSITDIEQANVDLQPIQNPMTPGASYLGEKIGDLEKRIDMIDRVTFDLHGASSALIVDVGYLEDLIMTTRRDMGVSILVEEWSGTLKLLHFAFEGCDLDILALFNGFLKKMGNDQEKWDLLLKESFK